MTRLPLIVATFLIAAACQERNATPRESAAEVASRQASRVDPAAAEQAIVAINRQWNEALANKDAVAVADLFTEDGVAIYGGNKYEGRDAIRREAEDSFAQQSAGTGSFTSERIIVSEDGRMAYDIGTYSSRESPDAPERTGRYLTLFENVGGEWKATVDITSDKPAGSGTSD